MQTRETANVVKPWTALSAVLTVAAMATDARGAGRSEPAAHPLTLGRAVAMALAQNPDARSRRAEVDEAHSARAGASGAFGPKLVVDANAQRWTSPYVISFGSQAFTAREAFTFTAGASLVQPLTPLFGIFDQYKVQELGVDIAGIRSATARRDVALGAIGSYYRLLEAERLSEIADASVAQLDAQQKQARSLLTNGLIGKSDLLRADLALANARQRSIQARGNIDLARGELAAAMGERDADAFEPMPYAGEPPAEGEPTLESAAAHAVARRLELRELDRRIDQAGKAVSFAKSRLLPDVSAALNYTHTEGSPFQPVNAAYAGLLASWNVWDWGTTLSGIAAAESKLEQARLARGKAEDEVRLEARRALVNARAAREALNVLRIAISEAEENYRIVTRKFENAAATSFDVVDAEALLTQARAQAETALYDLLIALATLDRATGAPLPGEQPSGP